MNEKLVRLQQLATVLNHERDLLNEQLNRYEKIINELRLGIRCHINISNDPNVKRRFGYTRYERKWGLFIEENDETWPLFHAPMYLRIEAAKHLESFLDHLLEASKKHMERVIKATEDATIFNEQLEKTDA